MKAQPESRISALILQHASDLWHRLFRNDVGHVKLESGARLSYGLCKGSGDLIGLVPIQITQAMVGRTLAVFCSIEVKQPGSYPNKGQRAWMEMVEGFGGIAGVARSEADYDEIIQNYMTKQGSDDDDGAGSGHVSR